MASFEPWQGGERRPSGGAGGSGSWDFPSFGTPFSSDLWDPAGNSSQLGFSSGSRDVVSALAHAHVDWRETDKEHIFRVDLPGVRKEDLKVQVEDENILQISGERVMEEEDKVNDKWHRVERQQGRFSRRFRLPENVIIGQIKCALAHGVLTVSIPKKETIPEAPRNVRYIDVA